MELHLDDKHALITGSTQGMGRAMAESFLEEGTTVFINGREKERVESVVEELSDLGNARPAPGDVSSGEDVDRMYETVSDQCALDILINNAGIFTGKPFEEITDEEWLRYFNVNVVGAVRLARRFLDDMLDQNWGRIINVASEAGVKPKPKYLHYSTTKTALLGLSRGLAELTKGTGVTVNSLLPGPTRTENVRGIFQGRAEEKGISVEEALDEFFEEEEPTSLLQRLEEPEEIAKVALFLCSEHGAVINGSAQRADGGMIRSIL